jgi:hypothetical protein
MKEGDQKMSERIKESNLWKIFYHEAATYQKTYWLLCKVQFKGLHRYYKIVAKIDYIDDNGNIVRKEAAN